MSIEDVPHMSLDLEESVSVLSADWVRAAASHIDTLASFPTPVSPDALEVSPTERAHSIAAIVMLVFAIESNIARLAAHRRLPQDSSGDPSRSQAVEANALALLRECLDHDLYDRVQELFVIRDTLAHNHVLRVVLGRDPDDWEKPPTLELTEALHGRQDSKYRASADPATKRTNLLGLHLIPTLVRRWDVAQMLPVVIAVLDRLVQFDVQNMPSLSDQRLRVQGKLVVLRDVSRFLDRDQTGSPVDRRTSARSW